ncbi:MAG: hypothetical protein DRQ54_05825 [Gammaproteobacteria bacterium]|nr:MAG: hypothetical protein DRQ54_05825 [Gammaproteobacteria bacterium]
MLLLAWLAADLPSVFLANLLNYQHSRLTGDCDCLKAFWLGGSDSGAVYNLLLIIDIYFMPNF